MRDSLSFPKLKSNAILAPMSGFSDIAFRTLAKKYNCGLTFTEFVSANAIVQNNKKTFELLQTDKSEKPSATQIFGSDPKVISKAVMKIENDFDIIDLNCGCPANKVLKTRSGSDLLKKPELISEIISKMCSSTNKIITAKIRLGINDSKDAIKIAKAIEDAGASAITVHGRTQAQGYSGKADWKKIEKIKENVNVPVFGNGDVKTPEEYTERRKNVDGVMIGRGALGNPYLFQQIYDLEKKGKYSNKSKIDQFKEYLKLAENKIKFEEIKHHAMFFTKGIEGGTKIRSNLAKTKTIDEIKKILI